MMYGFVLSKGLVIRRVSLLCVLGFNHGEEEETKAEEPEPATEEK